MIELLMLFILFLLTALARYIVFDAFEPLMFATIFLLPVAALGIFIISKRLAYKELSYQPKDIREWSFYNIQKSLLIAKPLFKGNDKRGYVKRYFAQKWKYAFADIMSFNWYLSLEIQMDQDIYDVRWYREKWISAQDQWAIYKNGQQIGEAQTIINIKNAAKFKEAIKYRFYDKSYISSASTVTSSISLIHDEEMLGTLKRNHILSNVQAIDVKENREEYIIALIIHSYYFKN